MIHKEFLIAMAQLSVKNHAQIVIGENVIFIKSAEKNHRWTLSTQLLSGEEGVPSDIRSCLSSRGVFCWQSRGAYLKVDPVSDGVFLIDEVEMEPGKFIPFKEQISAFAALADEWKETVCSMA